jgi:hypothetical protein
MARGQPPRNRRYRPLFHYLEALPPEQQVIRLSLTDLQGILGPPSAPTVGSIPNWNAAGVAAAFRHRPRFAAQLDRTTGVITLTRREA